MGDTNSLIDIGPLSEVANTFLIKISEAVGGLLKPWQIKRVAQAEAEAEIIQASAKIEISDLTRRAVARFVEEEKTKQLNMESITKKALMLINDESRPDQVENDWISYFFDKCRIINNDEMQNLWSKILAGQVNSPGSYSKRTIDVLSIIEKKDALLFTELCNFKIYPGIPLIYNAKDKIYNDRGIDFRSINHLESLGLLHSNFFSGYVLQESSKQKTVNYFSNSVNLEFKKSENNEFNIGQVLLTQAGQQLSFVCGGYQVDGFFDYLIAKWQSYKYKIL